MPDYQTLMRPVLHYAREGEVRINDAVDKIADEFELSPEEREELLPSGRQTVIYNRTQWAKTYLKQAGLVRATRRAHYELTDRGREALDQSAQLTNRHCLKQFAEFQDFQSRSRSEEDVAEQTAEPLAGTLDETLQRAHRLINESLQRTYNIGCRDEEVLYLKKVDEDFFE
ncbi:hypothetical protein D1224_15655 [Henriciella barbarensis]|uniref:Restriction system protein Mrr-like N-terminal domain-containing protein n=1 Tax=Henriciella barbarensis TaxID=86342 RepID=A0A399QQI4_9PROT|nr:winged helix-turn-helix domain-containing protein [Henriciella barbarensis]RIJ20544.1 hypothetical protein D1224_15655 [Henriciella barbarensis]